MGGMIDNTLAANVPQFNLASTLQQGAQAQAAQDAVQQEQLKAKQQAVGSEMRGVAPFVNSPDFPAKWADAAGRLLQNGTIDQQTHDRIANSPSPLMLKSIIAQTDSPEMALKKDEDAQAKTNADRNYGLAVNQDKRAGRAADRADATPLEQAAERAKAAEAYGLKPGTPEYNTFALGGSPPDASGKPIPYETLGGTNFLVKQPGGSYTSVDPKTLAGGATAPAAAPAAPGAVPAPAPAAPGSPPAAAGTPPAAVPGAPATPPAPAADVNAVDPTTGRREAWLKSQSPDVQAYIKKIADYEIDPRTTSIKGGHREQVLSAVAQYDPTYDQNTFGSRSKAIKDFSTGAQGNSIRSFDVAIDHLDTLQKYAKALDSGNIRAINAIRNAWLSETGSTLPTNVQAVTPIVGAEVSKAIIGSNNALADREELRKPLNNANSYEQIAGAAGAYKDLMAGQLKGLKKQYEDTTGKKDFDNRIRENTRNVLFGGSRGDGKPSANDPLGIR